MSEDITQHYVPVPGGSELALHASRDTDSGPLLMIWPAMGVQARKYGLLLDEFAARGITSVAVDFRGFGASRPATDRTSTVGYHEIATVDFPAVVSHLESRYPGRPIVLLGHSLGAQTGLMYAANSADKLAGIAFVAANTPYFRAYPGVSPLAPLLGTTLASAIARVVGYYPGWMLGRQPRRLIDDWARLARTGSFDSLAPDTAYTRLMERIQLPVLGVTVAGDWMAPPSALDALLEHVPHAEITRWHCGEDATGGKPAGHIGWIRRGAAAVAEHVAGWIGRAAPAS